ncbi:methyl-accepting chemotaxis protein [Clostridium estertheticum]|uniref:methyl-accepting chemotaxis protein n=1 Tax=Clostridium estertheticum TaxID=238834 RepID=UPI001C7E0509|nr:HAMP domain-containing methyl-accepting chemotaxis protein [Clostridium estertheticum]MBX4263756.1 methyl-accepting chemotaxis protein [Clostridium estertheticum]WLC87570.1 methyl-accepting chemotaxis protein [Clostridium estertheticum]
MFKSIRKNLIFNFVVMATIILIINTTFLTYQIVTGLQNQMKYDGSNLANIIKTSIENAGIDNIGKIQSIVDETYDQSEGNLLYIGVASPDRTLVAGTSKDSIGQKIDAKELENVFKGKTEAFMFEWKNTPAYNVAVPIKQGEKVILSVSVGISVNNMENAIRSGIVKAIIGSIIILMIVTAFGIIIGKRIGEPIESLERTLGEVGKGDLTAEYKVVKRKDEIGRLAYTSSETTKNIRELIKKIKSISLSLNTISQDISNGGEEVASASEEIATAVTSVSQQGRNQTKALSDALKILEDFSSDLNNVSGKLVKLAQDGEEIKNDSTKGAENITSLSNTIEDMQKSFHTVRNKVENLDETISQINSIVDVINSVAKQTNLLALNASIEAARAGESGKGFSVVAGEIKKLAEEVLTSAKNITGLVNKVMKETRDVSETTDFAANIVAGSKENIEESVSAFREVINKVNNIPVKINEVNEVLQRTMKGKDKILSTVERIASNSEEISSLSEEVTASTEEQAAITNEIAIRAKKLLNMANALEKNTSSFKV